MSRAAFAATMIALGIMGLVRRDFGEIWQPVPNWVPARHVLAILCALISLGSGLGLLWRRSAPAASGVLFAALLVWLLVLRLPNLFYQKPLVLVAWTFGSTAVMVAGAWVLHIWFASERSHGCKRHRQTGIHRAPRGTGAARRLLRQSRHRYADARR